MPAGDHRVPGTVALPAVPPAAAMPVVVLLHGDLSNRNENGDLFTRLAAALAAEGIASLRIDFAGSGDSEEPDLALDYPDMVTDAAASVDYLRADPRFDPTRVAVLGLSRGGAIAATLAGTVPGLAALVEWSGAVYNGYDEDPDGHDQARADGYVTVGGGFRLSLNWFDSIEQSHPLDDVAGFTGPVLAVTGSDDGVVPPGGVRCVAADRGQHRHHQAQHRRRGPRIRRHLRRPVACAGSPDGDHRLAQRQGRRRADVLDPSSFSPATPTEPATEPATGAGSTPAQVG